MSTPRIGARIQLALNRPVDIASLVFFRMAFGLLVMWEVYRYLSNGWVQRYYVNPPVRFSYYGFEWLPRLPSLGMTVLFGVLAVAGAGIAAGACYRVCGVVFTLCFSYVFLLEQTRYLDHCYLMVLLGLLLTVVPAHRRWSVDAWMRPRLRSDTVGAWALWVLRFQVAVVYLFGALAKLNSDWLAGAPMRDWMADSTDIPIIGPFLVHPWAPYIGAYGGLLFDLLIIPAMLWWRTRALALLAAAVCYLINEFFSIGSFPLLAFAGLLLFCEPDWPRRLLGQPARPAGPPSPGERRRLRPAALALLGSFVALQLLVPLRHHLYPGDASWTEEGRQFAWDTTLRNKHSEAVFQLTDTRTGERWDILPERVLPDWQAAGVVIRPELLRQMSHLLAELYAEQGRDVEVRAISLVTLNEHEPQLLVDPDVDLAAEPRRLTPQPWILPLE